MQPATTTAETFWAKADVRSDAECWNWMGQVLRGYGRVRFEGKRPFAHRLAYELIHGPVPDGLELDHLCRNTLCVNPSHLEPVTHRENVLRGSGVAAQYAKRTHCREGHPLSGDNLLVQGRTRRCRTCRSEESRASSLRWYHRHKPSEVEKYRATHLRGVTR